MICQAQYGQYSPVVVPDGSGGAYIAWRDERSLVGAYLQRVNGSGVEQWTPDGNLLNPALSMADRPALATDGQGGVIAAWSDDRDGFLNARVRVQRFSPAGTALWSTGGVAVCPATAAQSYASMDADGVGGCVVAWRDGRTGASVDVYAQRVGADGLRRWTDAAVAVSVAANDQDFPVLRSDGKGGACIAWFDARSGNYDIFAQRLSAIGQPLWTSNGAALCVMNGAQRDPVLVADGSGGAVVCWLDSRGRFFPKVFAQRVEPFGYLGILSRSWPGCATCPTTRAAR
ncbi:MAG: hypothetical protein IPJ04_16090 [Candidatus Eisenbacteria bacterium]|nr:hypothetical protein [Candidatus Eisenbacteria bacterium]